jgi:pimeloyl-ACP methyl ester carboxylesterase
MSATSAAPSSAARARAFAPIGAQTLRPPSLLLSALGRARRPPAAVRTAAARANEVEVRPGVYQGYWTWRPECLPGEAHRIRYTRADGGVAAASADADAQRPPARPAPPVVLIHGFGSNADQFRKTVGAIASPTYAIDLLGYGLSDKPDPRTKPPNAIYNFSVWGELVGDFVDAVVLPGEAAAASAGDGARGSSSTGNNAAAAAPTKAFLTANSVGGLAALEAAIRRPDAVAGVQVINISLRGLHVDRQPAWQRPLVAAFQRLLRETPLGEAFFASVAKPQAVRNIMRQAYGVKEAVTDELVDLILTPGLQPGAARVFLDFVSYSTGPLPQALASSLPPSIPLSIIWGAADPWESVSLGRTLLAKYAEEFIELPGVGHCPMDEAPELVNPLIAAFVERHAAKAFGGGGEAAAPATAAATAAAAAAAASG